MAHSAHQHASASSATARTLPTHVRNTQAEGRRQLMPFDQTMLAINNVGAALQGLCALLHAANGQHIESGGLLALLKPLADRLDNASCDLNDMHIVDVSEITNTERALDV